MTDRNDLRLVGQIDSPIKEGKTQNGDIYMWFMLKIEAKSNAYSTDNNYHQQINVMCFKKNTIDYLKRVKARQGNYCVIFGFISAFPYEVKGKSIITNAVNCNDVYIIKTKPDV